MPLHPPSSLSWCQSLPLLFFLLAISVGFLTSAFGGEIAILKSADVPYYDEATQGFRATLPPHTTVREYNLGGNVQRGREIGKTLRADPPDLVFAVGLKAALAAKLELPDTRVVFGLVLDPEIHGLPAANMIGIHMKVSVERQLAALRAVVPKVKAIGLLFDKDKSGPFVAEARRMAELMDLELVSAAVTTADEVPVKLRWLLPKVQALWVIQDSTIVTDTSVPFLLQTTIDANVPMFTFSSTLVQRGALGGLIVNAWDVGSQAGQIAVRLLRGDAVLLGRLHDPVRPQLALNLHIAEHFGLTPSAEVVRMAGMLFGTGTMAKQAGPAELIP